MGGLVFSAPHVVGAEVFSPKSSGPRGPTALRRCSSTITSRRPQRRLLGQRADREPVGASESGAAAWHRRFATRRAAMDEVMDWLGFYNSTRLHQTLGYVSPMVFEQRWLAVQQQDRKTA